MKIAIHPSDQPFTKYWIEYCEKKGIEYKLVDCHQNDIITQLSDCDGLMWHYNHKSPKDSKYAKQLLFALEGTGKCVFPNFNTAWHFDDKLAQKYLFESIGAPLAPSYVFYSKKEALKWAKEADFPKVFKLRNGASGANVKLAKTKNDAIRLIRKAFGRGFNQHDALGGLRDSYRLYKLGDLKFSAVISAFVRIFYSTEYARTTGRERGYVLFQDFIPGNDSDIRIVVIGNKAFGAKRMVRPNDFRASGSHLGFFKKELIPEDTVKLAFQLTKQLKSQIAIYDFVYDEDKTYVLEVSFGTSIIHYFECEGYWDDTMKWHGEVIDPGGWMVEELIKCIGK